MQFTNKTIKSENIEENENYFNINSMNDDEDMDKDSEIMENYENIEPDCEIKQEIYDYPLDIEESSVGETSVHEGLKNHKCEICAQDFNKLKQLRLHIKTVHEGQHKCEICEKVFNKLCNLQSHMKIAHTEEKTSNEKTNNSEHKCDHCNEIFRLLPDLQIHSKEVHGILKIHKCEICNKDFSKRTHLNAHLAIVHEQGDLPTTTICDLCGKELSNQNSLREHRKRVHEGVKNHICHFCSKAFAESNDLKKHIQG